MAKNSPLKLTQQIGVSATRSVTRMSANLFDQIFRPRKPRSILVRLGSRSLSFFRRRIPEGDQYAYEVHFAPTLTDVPTRLERFFLVGNAWKNKPQAPVALAFGFNNWKYGFMTDYCPNERLAFAPRQYLGWIARWNVKRASPPPSKIYVWGFTDRRWIEKFAKRRGIPLVRVEDGFLRSAELGASHSTPYSLVFDEQGLFYNTTDPNDLETVLRETDFSAKPELMEEAARARSLLMDHGLLKYNLPVRTDTTDRHRLRTRHRVLVIGQVDNDAAVRKGNPFKWRAIDIVHLAKLEHPHAEVLYRPHPDVHRGFQRSKFKSAAIKGIATIVPPEEPLTDILQMVDQVYTISSLSGLEALLRGVKVTTLGTPFYAGWGLTDDRMAEPKKRKLTLNELFAGVYLLYPKYLASPEDNIKGFGAAAFKCIGDREKLRLKQNSSDNALAIENDPNNLPGASVLAYYTSNISEPVFSTSMALEVKRILSRQDAPVLQRVVATIVCAKLNDAKVNLMLNVLVPVMVTSSANQVLLDLATTRPQINLARHFATLANRSPDISNASKAFSAISVPPEPVETEKEEQDPEQDELQRLAQREKNAHKATGKAEVLMESGEYTKALDQYCLAVLWGQPPLSLFRPAVDIAKETFDYRSSYDLAKLFQELDGGKAGWTWASIYTAGPYVPEANLMHDGAALCSNKVATTQTATLRLDELDIIEQSGFKIEEILDSYSLSYAHEANYAQALIEFGRFEEAVELSTLLVNRVPSFQNAVLLSRALCFLDRYEEAEALMEDTLKRHREKLVYDQYVKICIYLGDWVKGSALLEEAATLGIQMSETVRRKLAFSNLEVGKAFETFREIETSRDLARGYPKKNIASRDFTYSGDSILLLPIYGPGDELRWAAGYNDIESVLPHKRIIIGTEPRLADLLKRSIKLERVEIVPVQRILRTPRADLSLYDRLPFTSLMAMMDNVAADLAEEVDQIALVSDVAPDMFPTMDAISGRSYLKPDKKKVAKIRSHLPKDVPLCGINWRSSITMQSRSEHYVTVQELAPILEKTQLQFVNLQYDDCAEELAWLEENFPGRVINLEWIDQYDDLDSAAALIYCMDMVIAPCTAVAEMAGGLGRPTIMLANSSELSWRVREETQRDVWHSSMEHVKGTRFRDKESLVDNLLKKLQSWEHDQTKTKRSKTRS